MNNESQEVKNLFAKLCAQPKQRFPQKKYQRLDAPSEQGVYIIRKKKTVLHVGRTLRGRGGLKQRLQNHLHGASSFTKWYLQGNGATLRKSGYTYQCLKLENPRKRALVEAYAAGILCPKHIGLGE